MQGAILKLLSYHYRNLPKIFSNGFPIKKCKAILKIPVKIQVEDFLIKKTNYEKLLHLKIGSKFTFDKHIKTVC